MRERQNPYHRKLQQCRITPARAGKTPAVIPGRRPRRDHPRSCGKDSQYDRSRMSIRGSPPLVRERQSCKNGLTMPFRITPARAGKTLRRYRLHRSLRDHPRSCGKDRLVRPGLCPEKGSPPLVRERRRESIGYVDLLRITPARAGKTI